MQFLNPLAVILSERSESKDLQLLFEFANKYFG